MRFLVTGGRDFSDRALVWKTLNDLAASLTGGTRQRRIVIIHGACKTGADALADDWADTYHRLVERYPADWRGQGRAAGPKRNAYMIEHAKPDLVIAFPGGAGTADCVRRAKAAGIEVREMGEQAPPSIIGGFSRRGA